MDIRILHRTHYRYESPVSLGEHRLMLRPRDSFDLEILSAGLVIHPRADLAWMHDAYGNPVALAGFSGETDELRIESELLLRRHAPVRPTEAAEPWRRGAPIAYTQAELAALTPYVNPDCGDPSGALARFADGVVTEGGEAPHPLIALSEAIHARLRYRVRPDEGTQAPLETLSLGEGSCRDYAWLFIEAARRLGYAARFVSGYLHDRSPSGAGLVAAPGQTHAWADVYVPGDGWVEFDPTNRLVGDRQLIRVAVTRTPQEASPVSGSFVGMAAAPPPQVSVTIEEMPGPPSGQLSAAAE